MLGILLLKEEKRRTRWVLLFMSILLLGTGLLFAVIS